MSQSKEPLQDKKWTADDITSQKDKVFIVTGANSGLGFEASLQLARHGATVIMACRSLERGNEAQDSIMEEFPEADVKVMQLDLSSFDSIRDFVANFKTTYDRLDGLLNNAGVMQPPRRETEQGIELQFGVNHVGHFLLTKLLIDILAKTPDARIVTQSSLAHRTGGVNFDDLNWEQSYSRSRAYAQSKLANLLFAYELHRRLEGTDVRSIAVHPGYTDTDLQQKGPALGGKSLWSRLYSVTNRIIAQDVFRGALPLLYAAVADDVSSGDFIGPGGFLGMRGYPKRVTSNKASYHEEDAKKLWEISEQLTGEKFL